MKSLKSKYLPILFSLPCLSSLCSAANLAPNGVGQALVFPYYSVNNDLNTLATVVNTTDEVKAIKVNFLEADNMRVMLSYNVYLAAYDTWSFALVKSTSTIAGHGGEPTALHLTDDTSCAPYLVRYHQEFLPYAFLNSQTNNSMERSTEGMIQIIEMGVLTDAELIDAATAINGIPANCDRFEELWDAGEWFDDPNFGMGPATGGLIGTGSIIDVQEGTAVSYRADAIDHFFAEGQLFHTEPGDWEPDLSSANPTSVVIDSDRRIESNWDNGADAITALYMHDSVTNEFVLGSFIAAKTEWVISFPTKGFYVNEVPARAPFTTAYDPAEGACVLYDVDSYNRGGEEYNSGSGQICTAPPPDGPFMCWNTNVMFFYNCAEGNTKEDGSQILGSVSNAHGIRVKPFETGMSQLIFPFAGTLTDTAGNYTYTGYPVTGFSIQKYTNTNAQPGLLAQYASLFSHVYTNRITSQ